MGLMRRAVAREEQERRNAMEEQKRMTDRFASTLVIAASIIAAVRLARDQDISRPSPRLTSVIAESVGLARRILEAVVRLAGELMIGSSGRDRGLGREVRPNPRLASWRAVLGCLHSLPLGDLFRSIQ